MRNTPKLPKLGGRGRGIRRPVVSAAPGVDDYLRPGGVDTYFRPDGTSFYKRPA
jgi:hypothetical protein